MKILILSSPHPYRSAGVVALDIFNWLKRIEGNDVRMVVKQYDQYPDTAIVPVENYVQYHSKRVIRKSFEIFNKFNPWKGRDGIFSTKYLLNKNQTTTYYSSKRILQKSGFSPDVIIVLFMHDFLSYKNLSDLHIQTRAKVYLYPMDMAPLTGGCHYAWDCMGYKNNCGKCPALHSEDPEDQTFYNLSFKKKYIQETDVSVFAANQQIIEQIRDSAIFRNKEIIPGIIPVPDQKIFYPRDRRQARTHFGLDPGEKILFFGACSLADTRKGMSVLVDAFQLVSERLSDTGVKVKLLIAGSRIDEIASNLPFECIYIGFVQDYNLLALAYSAANFFISPSLEDSGPTMVLQSMLCQTPVISFDIGYSKDFIIDQQNGFKAREKNSAELADAIFRAVSLPEDPYNSLVKNLSSIPEELSEDKVMNRILTSIGLNQNREH